MKNGQKNIKQNIQKMNKNQLKLENMNKCFKQTIGIIHYIKINLNGKFIKSKFT